MFIQKIREYISQPGDYMISLDVTDLYPSTDLKEMTHGINDIIMKNYSDPKIFNTM